MNETTGLEARYHVEKINDPTGRHDDCRYFVLDPQHDPIAREALRDYAVHALSYGHLGLYTDLDRWLTRLDRDCPIPPAGGRNAEPPEGWFVFGTHVDEPVRLEFSEETDEALMPLWERPIAPTQPATSEGDPA